MGVHPEGDGFVAVSHSLRHAGDVCAVGDGNAGKAVPEYMRVEIGHAAPLGEPLHIAGRALRVHGFGTVFLRKDPLTDGGLGLLEPKLAEKRQRILAHIDGTGFPVLGRIQIHPFVLGVAQIPGDGQGSCLEIHVFPPERTTLSPPDARINQDVNESLPFQRFLPQGGQHLIDFHGA